MKIVYIRPDRTDVKKSEAKKLFVLHDDIEEFLENSEWSISSYGADGERPSDEVMLDALRIEALRMTADIFFREAMKVEYASYV